MFTKKPSQRRSLARAAIGAPLAAALAGIAYSRLFVPHKLPLPPALDAERRELHGRAGRLSYYVAGEGEPLLLVHSVNAAASAYEVRPLFERYRTSRRVYALDLPGFGFSDRSPREYTPRLFADAVLDMLDEIERESGPTPIDTLALSLGSEFLARAAVERPEGIRSVALVTPTGLRRGDRFYGPPGSNRGTPGVREFFAFPLWGRPFFDLLNSRPSQRYFLKQTFGSYEAVDKGLLDYDYLTAHQPDAEHAPFAFISGMLFSADINRIYESLQMPVWLAYGTRGEFSNIDPARGRNLPGWQVTSFQAGGLPYFEQPEAFGAAYDAFLQIAAGVEALDRS
ncbi:MAG TPA: alpha/beta fold hydrolase [Roseiflexaceae bacterium]|nr:alpha/beta fold hydrolase [Roseiflexaceae bacterium]